MDDIKNKIEKYKGQIEYFDSLKKKLVVVLSLSTAIFFVFHNVLSKYYGYNFTTGTNILFDIIRWLIVVPIYFLGQIITGFLHPVVQLAEMQTNTLVGTVLYSLIVLGIYTLAGMIVYGAYVYVGVELIKEYLKSKIRKLSELATTAMKQRVKGVKVKNS